MPRLRSEQIQSIENLQVSINAAIAQSKIANNISDPTGWISKGTVTVVDDFNGNAGGYQEFGLNILGTNDSGLKTGITYNFKVNEEDYFITPGTVEPISYDTVVALMDAKVTEDNLVVAIVSGDIRITNELTGFENNVTIDIHPKRHRLHDYLIGFSAFEEPVGGKGITWGPEYAGRIFFDPNTNEMYMGTSTDPYYQSLAGGTGESKLTALYGSSASDWDGTSGSIYRSATGFSPDASNLTIYLNGVLLQYGVAGDNDYQVDQGLGVEGLYTDVILNSTRAEANDKITMIVYDNAELSSFASKAWVLNKLTDNITLDGDTTIDGDIVPGHGALHDIGTSTMTWKNLYLNDSLYFRPIGTGDNLRIYRHLTGEDTQLKFQVGTSANDKFVFEDATNTAIMTIDGAGNVNIPGDLFVQGTTTYMHEENTTISDADFYIKETTPAADGDATYSVKRASGDVAIKWNDSIDRWQAVYGSTANITSDILTEADLTSGKDLDSRYLNHDQVVATGSTVDDGAIKYAGVYTGTNPPNGVFYGGNVAPDSDMRLNFGGNLHVNSLHTNANSVYVGGAKLSFTDNKIQFSPDAGVTVTELLTKDTTATTADMIYPLKVTSIIREPGAFYSGTNEPLNINRINLDGILHATGFVGPLTGNSSTATKLETARTIGGVSFDGSTNIDVPGVNIAGNQDTSGNSATATTADKVKNVVFHADTVDPTGTTRLNMDGYFYATRVYNAVWNDLAEFMAKAEDSDAGDVVVMTKDGVKKSSKRADKAVVGVHSDTFGYALGAEDQENKTPVGLAGKVLVKVREKLEIGDLLVSDVDGFATKATDEEESKSSIILGKVLEDSDGEFVKRIWVMIKM